MVLSHRCCEGNCSSPHFEEKVVVYFMRVGVATSGAALSSAPHYRCAAHDCVSSPNCLSRSQPSSLRFSIVPSGWTPHISSVSNPHKYWVSEPFSSRLLFCEGKTPGMDPHSGFKSPQLPQDESSFVLLQTRLSCSGHGQSCGLLSVHSEEVVL